MLQSAQSIPQATSLAAQRAIPTTGTLAVASGTFDPTIFATRDGQLQYRDLVVAANLIQVAVRVSTIWAFSAPQMAIPTIPNPGFDSAEQDTDSSQQNGGVVYVLNTSFPVNAVTTDEQLYYRDALLMEAVARAGNALSGFSPFTQQLPGVSISDAWSTAKWAVSDSGVSGAGQLNCALFTAPDQNLAARDNQIASVASRLISIIASPLDYATRLLIQIGSRDPATFVLSSRSGTTRVWTASPALSLGRNTLTYDTAMRTLSWIPEDGTAPVVAQSVPVALGPNGENTVQYGYGPISVAGAKGPMLVSPSVPASPDSATRLGLASLVSFGGSLETNGIPANLLASSGSTILLNGRSCITAPGTVNYPLGISSLPAGTYRVSLLVLPSSTIVLPGATFSQAGSTALPSLSASSWSVSFVYSAASPVTLSVGGTEILVPSGTGTTAPASFSAAVYPAQTSISTTGPIIIQSITLVESGTGALNYPMSASLSGSAPSKLVVSGRRMRTDAINFDFTTEVTISNPELALSYSGLVQAAPLTVCAICTQAAQVVSPTPDTIGLEAWKARLLKLALSDVRTSYFSWINAPATGSLAATLLDAQSSVITGFSRLSFSSAAWGVFVSPVTGLVKVSSAGSSPSGLSISVYVNGALVPQIEDGSVPGTQYIFSATQGVSYAIQMSGTGPVVMSVYPEYRNVSAGLNSFDSAGIKRWMSDLAVHQPRMNTASPAPFRASLPGDVGKPALAPAGISVDYSTGSVIGAYDALGSAPTLVALQPWMVGIGVYVADCAFWPAESTIFPSLTQIEGLIPTPGPDQSGENSGLPTDEINNYVTDENGGDVQGN